MIGQLTGTVATIAEDSAIISVGGVGYEVSATPVLLGRMTTGADITLSIETLVAETYIRLIAFESEPHRRTFRLLQSVQGVGAKAALSILNVLTPSEILDAIDAQDKTMVTRAQGVGPKLAQRLVTELKGKTGGIFGAADFRAPASTSAPDSGAAPGVRQDAISALINLGYDEAAARRAVSHVERTDDETVSALITQALKGLAPS